MEANGVSDIVTVIQGAVEDIELPSSDSDILQSESSDRPTEVIDIIISEWMGYFLLRESMLDSIIRARDKFLKNKTGLMFPSHCTMYVTPVEDEDERRQTNTEYNNAMGDWSEFAETTRTTYGVDMNCLGPEYQREQKEYYLLSSRWTELSPNSILAEPQVVKSLDMCTCTIADSRGIEADAPNSHFEFEMKGGDFGNSANNVVVSALSGWFTADFKSRTDDLGAQLAPKLSNPAFLSTGPEAGYTHWGQQTFYLLSSIPLIQGETCTLKGSIEMMRTKENARLYNARIIYESSRRKSTEPKNGRILMKGKKQTNIYQIP